jgi:hypothetical protein
LWCRPPPHRHRITWTFPWSGWWQPSLYTYSQMWSEKAIWKHILLVSALWKLYIKCCKNLSQLSRKRLKNFYIWILRFRTSKVSLKSLNFVINTSTVYCINKNKFCD